MVLKRYVYISFFIILINIFSFASANELNFVTPYDLTYHLYEKGYFSQVSFEAITGNSNFSSVTDLYNSRKYFACVINGNNIYYVFSIDTYDNVIFGRKAVTTDNSSYKSLNFKNGKYNAYTNASSSVKVFNISNGSFSLNSTGVSLSSNTDLPEYVYSDLPINIYQTEINVESSPAEYPDTGLLKVPKFEIQNNIAGSYSVLQITLGDFVDIDYSRLESVLLSSDSTGYLSLGDGLFIRNNRLFAETRRLKFNESYHLQIEYNYDTGEGFLYNGVFVISSADGSSGDISFTNQDSTNNIINNDNDNTDKIINSITKPYVPSGDYNISSGDFNLGITYTNPFNNLISEIINLLRVSLTTSQRRVNLGFLPILDNNFIIDLDSNFRCPYNTETKIFIGTMINGAMLIGIIYFIISIIHNLTTGNLKNLAYEFNEEGEFFNWF